jgi:hypothetical protein
MSLIVDFGEVFPEFKYVLDSSTGHFERVDERTVKWIPDNPVSYTVTSFTIEVWGLGDGGRNAQPDA